MMQFRKFRNLSKISFIICVLFFLGACASTDVAESLEIAVSYGSGMAQQKVLLSGLRIHTETFTLDLEENQTLVNRWDGKVSREAYQALLTLVTSDSFPTGEHYLVDAQQGVKSHWMVRIDKDGTQIGTFLISGLCPGQVHQVLRIIENQLPPSYRFPLPMKKPGL